jgi:hypothetical protein
VADVTLVPIREVLARGVNMHFLDEVRAKVVEDWKGEACVSSAAAAKALALARADEEAMAQRHAEFTAYLADRDRKRAEAGEQAVAKVRPKLLRQQQDEMLASGTTWDSGTITAVGQRLTPASSQALSTIRREALEAFDLENPPKALEDF